MGSLIFVAVLGFIYRAYRMTKGGPAADVWGQGILGLCLVLIALGVSPDVGWPRWSALAFAVVFGVVVMPVWVLSVLIPMRPGVVDYVFTAAYWSGIVIVGIAAVFS